jgi:glucosyl-dolichyl phosphate glucuronosyltransferase
MSSTDMQRKDAVDVTVILCSYNRSQDLADALESIAACQMPGSATWEILVVDNNSNDDTRGIVQGFCRRHPGIFRYLLEPTPGKSYALNSGIANARGEILVFTDDDVTFEPTWLANLTAPFRDPTVGGASGRTRPAQEFAAPNWLSKDLDKWAGILYAYFDLGEKPCELLRPPYGANMAFRKSIFEKHGGFRVDLGPAPGSQIRNEDTEFGRRILAAGERMIYEPSAVVYHPVPTSRVTKQYFYAWWFDYGRALVRERGHRPDVYGIPRDYYALIRCGAEIFWHGLRSIVGTTPDGRFAQRCLAQLAVGRTVEIIRRARAQNKQHTKATEEIPRSSRPEPVRSVAGPNEP